MPVGSGPQGVYFDLGEVRRLSRALMDAFDDAGAGSKTRLYVGQSSGSKDALVLYATDGTTHAVWCEDESALDSPDPLKVNPVPPGLFGPGVFGKDAFYLLDKDSCRVSVDSTINSKLAHRVAVISGFDGTQRRDLTIPKGTGPTHTYYGISYAAKTDVMGLLTGLGMLYGFGDSPGLILHQDRLEGISTGDMPGKFEIKGRTDCNVPEPLFFKLTRPFCFVALNMLLAAGILDSTSGLYLGVYDESALGRPEVVFLRAGRCAVFCESPASDAPNWVDYMPVAFIDQVTIDQPSAFLMFSALASLACTESCKCAGLGYRPGFGLRGGITTSSQSPGGRKDIEVWCESELGTFPQFNLSLTKDQVVAFSNTLGAAGEDAKVELILGEDDEIVVSVGSDENWMIRLK